MAVPSSKKKKPPSVGGSPTRKLSAKEALARVDTMVWVANVALMAYARYAHVLSHEHVFGAVFPGVSFTNPRLTHSIGEAEPHFVTTKREVVCKENRELYTAWQIAHAIADITAVVELYLKSAAVVATAAKLPDGDVLDRFSAATGVAVSEFTEYARLLHFMALRNIGTHNLGRINERFRKRTGEAHHADGPYVYYPSQPQEYRDLIDRFVAFVEARLAHAPAQ